MIDYGKLYYSSFTKEKTKRGIVEIGSSVRQTIKKIYSNCIVDIPQKFQLEITENNKINVLLGSKLVLFNGSIYTEYTTDNYPTTYNTITTSSPSNKYVCIFWRNGIGCKLIPIEAVYSGDTQPTTTYTQAYWLNTTALRWEQTTDGGETWVSADGWSAPVALLKKDANNKWQFVKDRKGRDIIFNGTCLVGHHTVIYPNVSGLLPNEFNTDGTLKSVERVNNALRIIELRSEYNTLFFTNWSGYFAVQAYGGKVNNIDDLPNTNVYYYIKEENTTGRKNASGVYSGSIQITPFIEYSYDGTTVTDFTIRQPYEGAAVQYRYEDEII